jgi:DNA-binding CsgD family transcriptional regulator
LLRRKLLTLLDRAMFSGLEKDLDELVDLSARTVHSIRSLSFDLSPPVLYELGLAAALDWLAERHDGQEGVKVSFHAGARPAPPLEPDRHDLPAAGPSRLDRLCSREREVLQRLAEGAGTRQIAESLHLSPKTVETHRAQLMEKLGLHSVAELTKLAIREGLTPLE